VVAATSLISASRASGSTRRVVGNRRRLATLRAGFEHDMVCDLRRMLDRYPAERDLALMCRALRQQKERFARLRDSGDVARHLTVRKTVNHSLVGAISVDCDALTAPDSDLHVVVFTVDPGSQDAFRLDLLRVMGAQSFAIAD
jgi:hypothetical protein